MEKDWKLSGEIEARFADLLGRAEISELRAKQIFDKAKKASQSHDVANLFSILRELPSIKLSTEKVKQDVFWIMAMGMEGLSDDAIIKVWDRKNEISFEERERHNR